MITEQLEQYYRKGKYKELIEYCNRQKLSDADSIYYKGLSYYALSQYMKALSCFHKINSLDCKYINGNTIDKDSELYIRSNFYKASSLYVLKKHQASIEYFSLVPDSNELAMCANFYKGLCYQEKKYPNYIEAEKSFKKTIELYKDSHYEDKNSIKSLAEKALITNLISQEKFNELIKSAGDKFDKPDEFSNTLLIYATIAKKNEFVKQLIDKGANPFYSNKYGDSSFSLAIENRNKTLIDIFATKLLPNYSYNWEDKNLTEIINDIKLNKSDWQSSEIDIENLNSLFAKVDMLGNLDEN